MTKLFFTLSLLTIFFLLPSAANAYLAPIAGALGVIIATVITLIVGVGSIFFMLSSNLKKLKNFLFKRNNKKKEATSNLENKNDVPK